MTECEQIEQIALQHNITDYGYASTDGVVDWVGGIRIYMAFTRPYPRALKRATLHSMEELKAYALAPPTPVWELSYNVEGLI